MTIRERVDGLHYCNHWRAFADDPWTPDLDGVTGDAWDEALAAVPMTRRLRRAGRDFPVIDSAGPHSARAGHSAP